MLLSVLVPGLLMGGGIPAPIVTIGQEFCLNAADGKSFNVNAFDGKSFSLKAIDENCDD